MASATDPCFVPRLLPPIPDPSFAGQGHPRGATGSARRRRKDRGVSTGRRAPSSVRAACGLNTAGFRLRVLVRRWRRHRDRHGLASTSCRAESLADARQTNPNDVSGKHLASFAVKSVSPPAAKDPLVARMRQKGGTGSGLLCRNARSSCRKALRRYPSAQRCRACGTTFPTGGIGCQGTKMR